MDGPFFPAPHPDNEVAPGSAEVLHLRRALFVIKGQYFNPLTNKDTPLPPHRWVLFQRDGDAFSESATSTKDGIAGIFEPDTSGIPDDAEWDLMMIPVIPGLPNSERYAHLEQIYIDVEKNEWVDSPEFTAAVGASPSVRQPIIAGAPLMRYPLWSTNRHAEKNCGFRAPTPPDATAFPTTGLFKTSELKPHGSTSEPWVLQLDEGYVRLFVQLRFYDFTQKLERPIGAGILLRARKIGHGSASSSVMLPGGTFFLLYDNSVIDPDEFRYSFSLPPGTRMSLSTNLMRVDPEGDDLADIGTDYFLPERWACLFHECWEGAQDASAAVRRPFAQLAQTAGQSPGSPLCFHLDDMVLARTTEDQIQPISDRVAIFDGRLRLKKPANEVAGAVPFSTQKLTGQYLRAEEWFFERGDGLEGRTRLLEHEGEVFDIAERRFSRRFSSAGPFFGLRAAIPLQAEDLDLSHVGLVDSRYLDFEYDGVKGKLAHMFVWNSAFIRIVGSPGGNLNVKERTERLMLDCAEVWTGNHPAFPPDGDEKQKNYAIVSRSGLVAGGTIVKPRFHFATRKSRPVLQVDGGNSPANASIDVVMAEGRASGGNPMELFLKFNSVDQTPNGNPPVVDVLEYEFRGSATTDRFDDVRNLESTLAHELGHWMDLPDEYLEGIRHTRTDLDGRVYGFKQSSGGVKPLYLDVSAMMQESKNIRLRYIDEFYQRIFDSSTSHQPRWHRDEGPFIPIYAGERETLQFIIPRSHPAFNGRPKCWTNPVTFEVGRGRGFLFPIGTDESNKGPLFTPPGSGFLPRAFDGVAVFQTKIWFDFANDMGSLADQWKVMKEWADIWFDRRTHPRFLINWDGENSFRRVGIVFQPLFNFGPVPTRRTAINGQVVNFVPGDADIVVHIHDGDPSPTIAGSVLIDEDDLNHDLMRFALDENVASASVSGADIRPADLPRFHAALAISVLNRQMGTVEAF